MGDGGAVAPMLTGRDRPRDPGPTAPPRGARPVVTHNAEHFRPVAGAGPAVLAPAVLAPAGMPGMLPARGRPPAVVFRPRPREPLKSPRTPNRPVLLGCGAIAGLAAVGAWGFWPILSEDFARAEPWRALLSLTGEACGLLGLLVFAWRHGVRGLPVGAGVTRSGPGGGGRVLFWAGTAALAGGLLGDLAVTGSALLEERRGFARAVPAAADAVVTRTGGISHVTYYRFRVTFADAAGRPHAGLLDTIHRPRPTRGHPAGFEPRLPAVAGGVSGEGILRGAGANPGGTRFRLPVRYDPRRPARCWVAGEGWNRGNGGHQVFLLAHLFQAIAVFGAVGALWNAAETLDGTAAAPWASPWPPAAVAATLPALPLALEAFVLALFGVLWRIRGF